MNVVQYPSPVVPGPPGLALEMPEGWEQVWAPETLIAVRDLDTGGGHFLANVVIRFFQRVAPYEPEQVLAELGDYAAGLPEGRVGAEQRRTLAGREWVGAEVAFTERVGRISQVHWFTAAAQNDVLDVLQVTGSCALDRTETDRPLIDDAISSLTVRV